MCTGKKVGRKRNTHESFVEKVKEKVGEEYLILGEYTRNYEPVLIKHNRCGHIYEVQPKNFLTGTRCPRCSLATKYISRTKSHDVFKIQLQAVTEDKYELKSKYNGFTESIKLTHKTCNSTFDTIPQKFISEIRCPMCNKI